jgi:hypothetical protein
MVHAEVGLKWQLPFTGNHNRAVSYVREKYALTDGESSVSLFESEFNCAVSWDYNHCFLQFNSERDYLLFVLRWS